MRPWIPDWIRVPLLRVSTLRKIRRVWSEFRGIREEYIKIHDAQASESDACDEGFNEINDAEKAQIDFLQNALAEAETDWYVGRAFKQRVPLPPRDAWEREGDVIENRLKPMPLRDFKDVVIKAEWETWKYRREWMAFIFAVLLGVVTAVSVFDNILSTQRKLNDIQGTLNDTQSVLADTQAKLYDAQRKLTDLTEQVRRREPTTGKRGMIPRAR